MSVMKSINESRAARQMQQALRKNPNDVKALLQLATRLSTRKEADLAQKRKVLHRILSLEPAHQKAGAMLFEMDRAEIGGDPSRLSMAVILTDPSWNQIAETPLILRYSLVHQFLVYLLIVFTIVIGSRNMRNPETLIAFGAFFLFLMIPLWYVSVVIEIGDTELNVSRLFGVARWKIAWRDIKAFRANTLGKGIKIITHEGKMVEIPSRVIGYFAVIEVLRQMRPDLFHLSEVAGVGDVVQARDIVRNKNRLIMK